MSADSPNAQRARQQLIRKRYHSVGSFSATCVNCNKVVYPVDRVKIDDMLFHKKCITCSHCNKPLNENNVVTLQHKFYCKPHFQELFQVKDRFSSFSIGGKSLASAIPKSVPTPPSHQKLSRKRRPKSTILSVTPSLSLPHISVDPTDKTKNLKKKESKRMNRKTLPPGAIKSRPSKKRNKTTAPTSGRNVLSRSAMPVLKIRTVPTTKVQKPDHKNVVLKKKSPPKKSVQKNKKSPVPHSRVGRVRRTQSLSVKSTPSFKGLTMSEVVSAQKQFKKYDVDKKGYITRDEFFLFVKDSMQKKNKAMDDHLIRRLSDSHFSNEERADMDKLEEMDFLSLYSAIMLDLM